MANGWRTTTTKRKTKTMGNNYDQNSGRPPVVGRRRKIIAHTRWANPPQGLNPATGLGPAQGVKPAQGLSPASGLGPAQKVKPAEELGSRRLSKPHDWTAFDKFTQKNHSKEKLDAFARVVGHRHGLGEEAHPTEYFNRPIQTPSGLQAMIATPGGGRRIVHTLHGGPGKPKGSGNDPVRRDPTYTRNPTTNGEGQISGYVAGGTRPDGTRWRGSATFSPETMARHKADREAHARWAAQRAAAAGATPEPRKKTQPPTH